MTLSKAKSVITSMRAKIETASYTWNYGKPKCPIDKLVAQLCYPKHGLKEPTMSFRAIRLAYTAAGRLPTFHRFCWHIYAMFLPFPVTQPCDNRKRKKMVTRTSFRCPRQQNRYPNQLLSISDNRTGLCPVLNSTLVCSPLNQNGILLTSRNRPTQSWQMPSQWLNLNVRTDFVGPAPFLPPTVNSVESHLPPGTNPDFVWVFVRLFLLYHFLFISTLKNKIKKIFKNSCLLLYFIL